MFCKRAFCYLDLARGSIHNVVITKSWTDKKIRVNIERLSAFQSHRQMNLETTFGKSGRFLVIDLNHAVHHFQIDEASRDSLCFTCHGTYINTTSLWSMSISGAGVNWFGHVYWQKSMTIDPEWEALIKSLPRPAVKNWVKSFLPTVAFCKIFMPGTGHTFALLMLQPNSGYGWLCRWTTNEQESVRPCLLHRPC